MLELGKKVKCKITGFTGILTAHAKHLNGCDRWWVEPPIDKDGKLGNGNWFDDANLDIISQEKIKTSPSQKGGFNSPIK